MKKIILAALLLTVALGYFQAVHSLKPEPSPVQDYAPCRLIGVGKYDCTDEALLERLNTQRPLQAITAPTKEVAEVKTPAKTKFVAYSTAYSRKSSCHNPRGSECLTAIGRDTKEGVTVACPRDMKLGTKVRVNGKTYTCEDRYAKFLDGKRGLPTVDIFMESNELAIQYGLQKVTVEVL